MRGGREPLLSIENVSVQQRKIDLALIEHSSTAPPLPERPRAARHGHEKKKPLRPAPSRKHEKGKNGRSNHRGGGGGGKRGRR